MRHSLPIFAIFATSPLWIMWIFKLKSFNLAQSLDQSHSIRSIKWSQRFFSSSQSLDLVEHLIWSISWSLRFVYLVNLFISSSIRSCQSRDLNDLSHLAQSLDLVEHLILSISWSLRFFSSCQSLDLVENSILSISWSRRFFSSCQSLDLVEHSNLSISSWSLRFFSSGQSLDLVEHSILSISWSQRFFSSCWSRERFDYSILPKSHDLTFFSLSIVMISAGFFALANILISYRFFYDRNTVVVSFIWIIAHYTIWQCKYMLWQWNIS
jgi:hypothetical protein